MKADFSKQITEMGRFLAEKGFFGDKFLSRDNFSDWAIKDADSIFHLNDPVFPGVGSVHPTTPIHFHSTGLGNSGKISVSITLMIDHQDEKIYFSDIRLHYDKSYTKGFAKSPNDSWDEMPMHINAFEREGIRQARLRYRR